MRGASRRRASASVTATSARGAMIARPRLSEYSSYVSTDGRASHAKLASEAGLRTVLVKNKVGT
jgi:hypothetical protein